MPNIIESLFKGAFSAGGKALKFGASGTAGRVLLGAGIGGSIGAYQGHGINSKIEGALKGMALGGIAGLTPNIISKGFDVGTKGGKFLWKANLDAGARSTMKRARLMDLGKGGIGPLTLNTTREATSFMNRLKSSPLGSITTGAVRAGTFALNHPFLTGGAVVGAVGFTQGGFGEDSPTIEGVKPRVNISYNTQAMMAAEIGQIGGGQLGSPGQMRESFEYANWMNTVGKTIYGSSRLGRLADSTVGLNFGLHNGRHS